MVWMETYFLCCSVRLGVMITSVLVFISLFIPSVIFFSAGLPILNPIMQLFSEDDSFKYDNVIKKITEQIKNDSTGLNAVLQLYLFVHMIASVSAFYGSLKLRKYFILPMIFLEFIRVGFCLAMHVLIMTVSKSHLDLGIVITCTMAGGFLLLYLGYNWASCLALYQIINLVNSERYKALYGDDPFKPLIPKTYDPFITEQVRVLITPTYQKQNKRNNRLLDTQPIISVLPVPYIDNNNKNSNGYNAKWKQSNWPTTTVKTPPTAQIYAPNLNDNQTFKLYHQNNNYDENYNNWQWAEIAPNIKTNSYNGNWN